MSVGSCFVLFTIIDLKDETGSFRYLSLRSKDLQNALKKFTKKL